MAERGGTTGLNAVADRKSTRRERRVSLRRYVLTAVSVTAALRAVLFVVSLFQAWPVGGAATSALGQFGVVAELVLIAAVIVGTAKTAAGLRARQLRWFHAPS